MIIGDMILANEVIGTSNSQIVLNNPNNIFPVLTTPAFVSFGVAIVVSGIDLTKEHTLKLVFSEDNEDSESETIFREIVQSNIQQTDQNPTLSANISLRNIRVNKLGYHKISLLIDEDKVTENVINIIKAD